MQYWTEEIEGPEFMILQDGKDPLGIVAAVGYAYAPTFCKR